MQCDFTQAELVTLDLAIIERLERARLSLERYTTSDKPNKSSIKLLETDIKRLEELHNKLSNFIEQIDIREDNRE